MESAKVGICTNCQKGMEKPAETCPHCGQAGTYRSIDEELIKLVERGQRVDAVKRVMRLTEWELKDSSAYVDALKSQGQ